MSEQSCQLPRRGVLKPQGSMNPGKRTNVRTGWWLLPAAILFGAAGLLGLLTLGMGWGGAGPAVFFALAALALVAFGWKVQGGFAGSFPGQAVKNKIDARRFEAVLAAMHDALFETDWKGIHEVNESFCRMTGFSREELIGARAPYPFWPAEEYARIAAALETSMRGQARDFELVLTRKNGERFPVLLSVSRIVSDGSAAGEALRDSGSRVLFSFRDISELKRSAQELAAAKERAEAEYHEREKLLRLLNRELRSPMTPILGLAGALRNDARLPADVREEMATIQRNAQDVKRQIDEALRHAGQRPQVSGGQHAPALAQDATNSGTRVLLVEDHADTAHVTTRILQMHGYQVTCVGTVALALRAADATPFDIMICDLGLPDGTGYDVMKAWRNGAPAIAFSGYATDEDIARTRAAGFAEHLTKPVDVDVLMATMAMVHRRT